MSIKQANIHQTRITASKFSRINSKGRCVATWGSPSANQQPPGLNICDTAASSAQRRVSDSAKSWRLLQVVPAVLILILSVPSGGLIVHISSTHLLLYALIIY